MLLNIKKNYKYPQVPVYIKKICRYLCIYEYGYEIDIYLINIYITEELLLISYRPIDIYNSYSQLSDYMLLALEYISLLVC